MDTNLSYCQRLAEVLCGLIADGVDDPFNVHAEIIALFPRLEGSGGIEPNALAALLTQSPDAQAKLAVVSEYTPSKWLLERELEAQGYWKPGSNDTYTCAGKRSAAGLCLSGGGIRSATFNLGVLQGLSQHHRLSGFTYLSSVSGGGYIHQFLANWIHNRKLSRKAVFHPEIFQTVGKVKERTALDDVQDFLHPIPNSPSARDGHPFGNIGYVTVVSEPLRWLRRYTNYLAPRKGLTGLDTWTILAVWLRNTILNFIIILSAFVFLLLLPHIPITRWIIEHNSRPSPHRALDIVVAIATMLCILIPGNYVRRWLCDCGEKHDANPEFRKIFMAMVFLFVASVIAAPAVYRSSLPGEFSYFYTRTTPVVNPVFAPMPDRQSHVHYTAHFEDTAGANSSVIKIDTDAREAEPVSRLRSHWEQRPASFLPHPLKASSFLPSSLPSWFTRQTSFPFTRIAFVLANALLLFLLGLAADKAPVLGKIALLFLGAAFAWLLLFGVRTLFYVASFSIRPELISSLGVVLLPPLLFGIPFITLALGSGLIGNDMRDEQREWMARLRAASFLTGASWLLLTAFSLLGTELFDTIARMAVAKYAVWSGWLVTTVGGVLAGRSAKSKGKTADGDDSMKKGISWIEVIATVAPPVFIAGLLILIAKLTNWGISSVPTPYIQPPSLHVVCISGLVALIVFLLFGWRVDINDFSMHSFYRDRLARCYAGASNPTRKPNRFTGFDNSDRNLLMTSLLPSSWRVLEGMEQAGTIGAYAGPFPIICTSINLTTGEDLAYQERKAASFSFTPLFSGFNVGWTAGRSGDTQFNGFVPTAEYVYTDQGGVSLAAAVAISGAAASPNMGYHTNPAIAFLLTVFNVRLGWWLRNTRRRVIASADPAHLPSVPRFGPLRLFDELMGRANDTASFIYLTDGGHFDNMGLYELIRRRCRTIVVCDSEADGQLHFEGIGMAIRKARLDFGVEVELGGVDDDAKDREQIPPAPPAPESFNITASVSKVDPAGISGEISRSQPTPGQRRGLNSFRDYPNNATHAVIGTVTYPEDPEHPGHILYIKSSLTGDEPADVLNFRNQHPTFPNETTLNQFFTESEFESYRRLGQHIIQDDETVRGWLDLHIPAVKVSP